MSFLNRFSSHLSPYQRRLVLLAPAVTSLVFFACGGTVSSGSTSGAPAAASTQKPAASMAPVPTSTASDAGTDAIPDAQATADAGEECVLTGGGGSTSSGGACMNSEVYTCTSGEIAIECSCPAAECTCGGQTIPLPNACAGGCSVPASVRTQCGALNIVKDDGGGSSGWSSSGASSGGSSSSSGGK